MRVSKRHLLAAICAVVLLSCFCAQAFAVSYLPPARMRPGSRGESVRLLQENLLELELYNARPDGVYGVITSKAVRSLQQLLSVPQDGICGLQTIVAFNTAVQSGAIFVLNTEGDALDEAPLYKGYCIGLDPGHQTTPDFGYEPVSPGSKRTKQRMSAGCIGIRSGINEYEITLSIAQKLRLLLEDAGHTVVLARTQNDVQLSNVERAQLMNDNNVDCWVRIHCDYSSSRTKEGMTALCPSFSAGAGIYEKSLLLAETLLKNTTRATGAASLAVVKKSDQAGFNWSASPVATLELGYLSNPVEDLKLNSARYQQTCAQGIFDGLLIYFSS